MDAVRAGQATDPAIPVASESTTITVSSRLDQKGFFESADFYSNEVPHLYSYFIKIKLKHDSSHVGGPSFVNVEHHRRFTFFLGEQVTSVENPPYLQLDLKMLNWETGPSFQGVFSSSSP